MAQEARRVCCGVEVIGCCSLNFSCVVCGNGWNTSPHKGCKGWIPDNSFRERLEQRLGKYKNIWEGLAKK